MRRRAFLSSLALTVVLMANTFALPLPAAEGRRLVLVTGPQSTVVPLSPEEVRKLYLGVPFIRDRTTLLPLGNRTDTMVYEVFMQKVMYMSGPAYERAIMTRMVRATGSIRPPEYAVEKDLLEALATKPNTVTYMWADRAEATHLKVMAELWHEQ